MKKLFLLLLTITSIAPGGFAQREVDFNLQMSPEMKYDQTIKEQTDIHMSYSGPREMMAQLKEKKVPTDTIMHSTSDMVATMVTGKMSGGSTFPLRMDFVKTSTNGKPNAIPSGSVIYGHSTVGEMPVLDSLSAPGMNDTLRKAMMQMMKGLFAQLSYPHKKVKIGGTVSKEATISIPAGGMSIDFLVTTHYRLTKIHDGIAQFAVTQEYTMQTRKGLLSTIAFQAKGKGKGHLDYDIAHQFYQSWQLGSTLDMDMSVKQLRFKLRTKSSYDQHATITAM